MGRRDCDCESVCEDEGLECGMSRRVAKVVPSSDCVDKCRARWWSGMSKFIFAFPDCTIAEGERRIPR
jgi:hypothetical protein